MQNPRQFAVGSSLERSADSLIRLRLLPAVSAMLPAIGDAVTVAISVTGGAGIVTPIMIAPVISGVIIAIVVDAAAQ